MSQMIQVTLFKPKSQFARSNAPMEGCGCIQTVIRINDEQAMTDVHWLKPGETHVAFDPEWLAEHVDVLWRKLGRAMMVSEILVVERLTKARCEIEKTLEEDGEDVEEAR